MANQKMSREQLGVKEKDRIVIKGNVSYSRIVTKVEGEELQKADERRKQKNQIIVGKPYYSITITNPVFEQGDGTPLAAFHKQNVYKNQQGLDAISFTSKSISPIRFYQLSADGSTADAVQLEAELGQGQEVHLLVDAYRPKSYNNLGSTFSAVMVPAGPISYYQSGIANDLAGFGVAPAHAANNAFAQQQPQQTQAQQVPDQNVGNGFVNNPAATQAPTQPVPPVQPNINANAGQPGAIPTGGPFGTATQPVTPNTNVNTNPFNTLPPQQ